MDQLRVVESIHGTWHYHLTREATPANGAKALCGATTMHCGVPISSWGTKSAHIPESYCKQCGELSGLEPKAPDHE